MEPFVAWQAPEATPETPMQIPYRGNAMHGVAHTVEERDYLVVDHKDDTITDGPAILGKDDTENDIVPIPVRIVDNTAPLTTRRKFSTNVLPIDVPIVGNAQEAILAVAYRQNRSKVELTNKAYVSGGTAGRIFYGPDANINIADAAFLDNGDKVTLETTEAIWVMIEPGSANGARIIIVQQWETSVVDLEEKHK